MSINPTFDQQREHNRQTLKEYIRQERVFTNLKKQEFYENTCLSLFNASKEVFSDYQLITLSQLLAFAMRESVIIQKVYTKGEFTTVFDTTSHILKVTYNYDKDVYETVLTNKITGEIDRRTDVYVEDFGEIMKEIKGE